MTTQKPFYAFLDLETTGFNPTRDSIIEIAIITTDEQGRELEKYSEVFVPQKSALTPEITKITGITQKEIDAQGKTLTEEKKSQIQNIIQEATIVGHNIDFDVEFLKKNEILKTQNSRIDTHELARILLPNEKTYALEGLSKTYKLHHTSAHRALSDTEASKELYFFLKQKIENLPFSFLQKIKPWLETKTKWEAKKLFLEIAGNMFGEEEVKKEYPKFVATQFLDEAWKTKIEQTLTKEYSLFIPAGNHDQTIDLITQLATESTTKTLIISPKIDFFPWIKKLPIPEVLFSPERFQEKINEATNFSTKETVFYLKCAYRHFLKFRGLDNFNLFLDERDLWENVCIKEEFDPLFQTILTEKSQEKILLATPDSFLRLSHTQAITGRRLIIDEAEFFAERTLFHPIQKASLFSLLEKTENETSILTQFFITRFCKEVGEKKLEKAFSLFPEKIPFDRGETFEDFAQELEKIAQTKETHDAAKILRDYDADAIRWANYFPEKGNLIFESWKKQNWETEKNKLKNFEKIFFIRQELENKSFFRIFLNAEKGEKLSPPREISTKKDWIIPQNLISATAPNFNSFSAEKIEEQTKKMEEKECLVAHFSSLESLKKVYDELYEPLAQKKILLLGEKVHGGDGKFLQKLESAQKSVILMNKLESPEFQNYNIQTLLFQKFPFAPPHPILNELDREIKISGLSMWDLWTIPQIVATIQRKIANFPTLKKIIWLDPRENTLWGKKILETIKK